jgi:hypothetical protein
MIGPLKGSIRVRHQWGRFLQGYILPSTAKLLKNSLLPTLTLIDSAFHTRIMFAFLKCFSEQVVNTPQNRKTGRFCNEDKLFFLRTELNLSDELVGYLFKNSSEKF